MPIITGKENVLAVYRQAAEKGWVIPCFGTENLTTTEAILTAATEYAEEHGLPRIPVTLAITVRYPHRSQASFYTATRRWDVGLALFRADAAVLAEAFPKVELLLHLDHVQADLDEALLDGDLSGYSSVMYDASALPMEENIRLTRAFVEKKRDEILIEGACDEIVDATGSVRCEITDAAKCEAYKNATGVDMVVANLGTEHRASSQDLHYHADAANAIRERIGRCIVLHGTSSVSSEQIGHLFADGICKVNIWTALERDSSPALTEFMVKNAAKAGGPALAARLKEEGWLGEKADTDPPASLKAFTTAERQQIVFAEMVRLVKNYLALWYR